MYGNNVKKKYLKYEKIIIKNKILLFYQQSIGGQTK